jgi:hypothetical protein
MSKSIFEKLKEVKTMPDLDALRGEVVKQMESGGEAEFLAAQKAFIKAKNRLKRIPLKDRAW